MRLRDLAARLGAAFDGDGERELDAVATLAAAGPRQLSFFANRHYRRQLAGSAAGAVVLAPADRALFPGAALLSDNPYLAFARAAALLHPAPALTPGVHPQATVDSTARLGADVRIEAGAVIAVAMKREQRRHREIVEAIERHGPPPASHSVLMRPQV